MVTLPAVHLRPFQGTDISFVADLARDERVTRFIGDGQPWSDAVIDTRTKAALDMIPIERPDAVRWFIAEVSDTPVALFVSMRRDEGVEIGYWVAPDHWGKGIAGAIVAQGVASVPDLFETSVLIGRVAQGNTASARALTRHGFTLSKQENGEDHFKLRL